MRRSLGLGVAMALVVLAAGRDAAADDVAHAEDARSDRRPSVWKNLRAGNDLLKSAPTAALLDGMWSLYATYATTMTNRNWDAPYPWGSVGQYSTRLLYGTSWTLMIAAESLAVFGAAGGSFEWIAEASYRSDWMVATDAPACVRTGVDGGCGLGVGDFAFLSFRPRGTKWWFAAGGGWIQQRISNDAYRTVAESSWVLSPVSTSYELVNTDPSRAAALRIVAGPGIYFGLHNGHMHETLRGQRDKGLRAPWHSMYGLDGGIGPGGRVEARVTFARRVGIEGELVVAPFLLGGPTSDRPSSDIAPLDFVREGMTVWRKTAFGVSWNDPHWPLRPVVGVWAAELSERPIDLAGHRGVILRFDIPLRVPGRE